MTLEHALLRRAGVRHGFGTRGSQAPAGTLRPRQVHGSLVVRAPACAGTPPEADAIVARTGEPPVSVVTADCVPVLVAARGGAAVAAIHAGWRGLAAGVVESGIDALRHESSADEPLVAVIGPHIGACCYEIDAPVLDALRHHLGEADHDALEAASYESHPGHWMIDLGALVRHSLERSGVAGDAIGGFDRACTRCDAERFHSYRRDGPRAGRLQHWIAPAPS